MSLHERFTDDEILLLNCTPTLIGSAMVFAEGSGLGTFKEMMANAKSYVGGAQAYPNNAIITSVLPNLVDHKEGYEQAKAFREKAIARFKQKGVNSKESMRTLMLDDCRAVSQLLDEKATEQEAQEYKVWALSIAENVAKAAKEGGFLGFGGEVISKNEKEIYRQIAFALGVTASLA
jgi:hypothetical protein